MASNYDAQFMNEDDEYALPDLFSEYTSATESVDEDDYVDDAIIDELEDDEDYNPPENVIEDDSDDNDIFNFDFFDDITPATESLEDDIAELGDMDGTNEDDDEEESDETEDEQTDDNDDEGEEDEAPDDLAAATDEQLEEDNQSPDDEMTEENVDDGTDNTDDIGSSDTLGSDPLKSIETKTAYRDKFLLLYRSIADSVTIMEDFTPEYNSEASKIYYTCKKDFNALRNQIYKICVKRMNSMTVDEVLRQYTICNLTYDAILRDARTFSDEYSKELKATESKEQRKARKYQKTEKANQTKS